MNFMNKYSCMRFVYLFISYVTAIVFFSCDDDAAKLVAEIKEHRPRKDPTLMRQTKPEAKPLVGLFVDGSSTVARPDGRSWSTAFKTINEAINESTGQTIYVAAGTYRSPKIIINSKNRIRLVGGYKAGELYEKDTSSVADDEWVVLDGNGSTTDELIEISGNAQRVAILGGFLFRNVKNKSAVLVEGTATKFIEDISIFNCRFEDNDGVTGGVTGGGLSIRYARDVHLSNLQAKNNRAAQGGFLSVRDSDNMSILGGRWEENFASLDGGALYLNNVDNLQLRGQQVHKNTANRHGGGVYAENLDKQTMSEINFTENTASKIIVGYGAGLAIETSTDIALSRLNFRGNSNVDPASMNRALGGALALNNVQGVELNLAGSTFEGNYSDNGGAIALIRCVDVNITGGTFLNNSATTNGGAVFMDATKNLSMHSTAINKGIAERGCGIYARQIGVKFVIDGTSIEKCEATLHGGGMFIDGGMAGFLPSVTVHNSIFTDNMANTGNGGALVMKGITFEVNFKNNKFERNDAKYFGGALALDAKDANAQFIFDAGNKIFDNTAADNGGGAISIVFDNTRSTGAVALPAATTRQLVFFMTSANVGRNTTTAGLSGNFIRITNLAVDDIAPSIIPGAAIFEATLIAAPTTVLEYFIAYSNAPADIGAPWNQIGYDYSVKTDVYTH